MENYKITDSELESGVVAAPDTLTDTPRNNKLVFDRLPRLIATKFNGFVDSVIANLANYYNKFEIDNKVTALSSEINNKTTALSNEINNKTVALNSEISKKANSVDVYVKTEVYTKTETEAVVANSIVAAGAGDMAKGIYDKNNNGIVDNAENAQNAVNAQNAQSSKTAENADKVNGFWFNFKDEKGRVTDEPYIHWMEG